MVAIRYCQDVAAQHGQIHNAVHINMQLCDLCTVGMCIHEHTPAVVAFRDPWMASAMSETALIIPLCCSPDVAVRAEACCPVDSVIATTTEPAAR